MKLRLTIVLIILAIVLGGIFGFDFLRYLLIKRALADYQPPPVAVSAVKAKLTTWHPFLSAVGSVVAIQGVEVTPEVSGTVFGIYFKSGDIIKKGTLMVLLDDRTDVQQLKSNLAQQELDKITYERTKVLYRKGVDSKEEYDTALANLQKITADVGKDKVLIDQKHIKAPFSGKLGIRQINLGQYLSPGDPIVSLQSLNPIYVNFTLPQQDLRKLYVGQPIEITTNATPQQKFTGKINALNSKVDANTRNILVQATVPNEKFSLLPGIFVNVKVLLPEKKQIVTVPETAVSFSLFGDTAYVIKQTRKDKNNKPILQVTKRYITVGLRQNNHVAITKGIKAGDEVVISNQLQLADNTRVIINNSANIQNPAQISGYE